MRQINFCCNSPWKIEPTLKQSCRIWLFLTAKSTDTDVEELMMTLWQQVKDTGSQKFQELQQDYHANKVSSQQDEEG
jgi:ribosome-associated toxin RatA of RatAB toxin-antitoxin module